MKIITARIAVPDDRVDTEVEDVGKILREAYNGSGEGHFVCTTVEDEPTDADQLTLFERYGEEEFPEPKAAEHTAPSLSDMPVSHFPVAFVFTPGDIRGVENEHGVRRFRDFTDDECRLVGNIVKRRADNLMNSIWDAIEEAAIDYLAQRPA
jgi:hypothetical protein